LLNFLTGETVIEYNESQVSDAFAISIAATLESILLGISNKDVVSYSYGFITGQDSARFSEWNHLTPFTKMECVHNLIEAKALENPTAEAIVSWDGNLSYAELDKLATQGATILIEAGVKPQDFVPFAYEKSLWAIVAQLAIIKAGAAFVPLDPLFPVNRIEDILLATQAKIVVTSEKSQNRFISLTEKVVVLSEASISDAKDLEPCHFTAPSVTPDDPVFVLFTSGSTGKPKGIIHKHGAISTHGLSWVNTGYVGKRIFQFASWIFDVSIIDMVTALISGACLCIPSEEDRRGNIVGVMNQMRVDYAIFTPLLAAVLQPSDVPHLKILAVGGEALAQETLNKWADSVKFVQIYGPAEVGISHFVQLHPESMPANLIGHLMPNCCSWIVDPDDPHRLLPPGAVGELVIFSSSLAKGYLNDEVKTGAAFLEKLIWTSKFAPWLANGFRIYRTGDLLRYNTTLFDGSVEFIGRKDHQIKLRGQRIEPNEIELHLSKIQGVSNALVMVPKVGIFTGELVAIVQMGGDTSYEDGNMHLQIACFTSLSITTMTKSLKNSLPEYMIPSRCLNVQKIPVLPSLKIDRSRVKSWLTQISEIEAHEVDSNGKLTWIGYEIDPNDSTALELSQKIEVLTRKHNSDRAFTLKGHDFRIQDTGIDSIKIMSLSLHIERTYGIRTPISVLLHPDTTVCILSQAITDTISSSSCLIPKKSINVKHETTKYITMMENLVADQKSLSRSDSDSGTTTSESTVSHNVFITGATGFLGRSLLGHLLLDDNIEIFALVRSNTVENGMARLIQAAILAGWWDEKYRSRIQIWPGDLGVPNLGLATDHLTRLYSNIYTIIHCGAVVNYSIDYTNLVDANILSTISLLEVLASSERLSSFIFVSGGSQPSDSTDLSEIQVVERIGYANGYAQSKFIAEQVVHSTMSQDVFKDKRLSIVKPGYIIGPRKSGAANISDFLWRMVAGCIEIGGYNKDTSETWLFVSDVDKVSSAILNIFLNQESHSKPDCTQLILDGILFDDLWLLLRDDFGYYLKALASDVWMKKLKKTILDKGEDHLLFPLIEELEMSQEVFGQNSGNEHVIRQKTDSIEVKDILKKNIETLIGSGFLPHPPASFN
jgi:amino acid adenylation domain-containing protein/thioester reductase-like protein